MVPNCGFIKSFVIKWPLFELIMGQVKGLQRLQRGPVSTFNFSKGTLIPNFGVFVLKI